MVTADRIGDHTRQPAPDVAPGAMDHDDPIPSTSMDPSSEPPRTSGDETREDEVPYDEDDTVPYGDDDVPH